MRPWHPNIFVESYSLFNRFVFLHPSLDGAVASFCAGRRARRPDPDHFYRWSQSDRLTRRTFFVDRAKTLHRLCLIHSSAARIALSDLLNRVPIEKRATQLPTGQIDRRQLGRYDTPRPLSQAVVDWAVRTDTVAGAQ